LIEVKELKTGKPVKYLDSKIFIKNKTQSREVILSEKKVFLYSSL